MGEDEQRWDVVAEHIQKRLREMRAAGNLSELARQSGVSDATWRRLLRGQPVSRIDKLDQVTRYLAWTPESIDRMLGGRKPVVDPRLSLDHDRPRQPSPLPTDTTSDVDDRLVDLEGRFSELEDRVAEIHAALRKSGGLR
jgi:transcriptional regulator with XRE-family HTH domain